ncbi:MAG TPA: hypothetical protein VF120_11590 [Ktedonobacterales bacterium]
MSQAPTQNPTEEVVAFFSRGSTQQEIAAFRLSDAAQERLRELLHRNSAGESTTDEQRELDQMVLLDELVSLIKAKASAHSSR